MYFIVTEKARISDNKKVLYAVDFVTQKALVQAYCHIYDKLSFSLILIFFDVGLRVPIRLTTEERKTQLVSYLF